jgi:hypothetical protein
VYSGKAADIILFLQPKLLNRGLKFSNQEIPDNENLFVEKK